MKKVLFAAAALGIGLGLAATDASAVSFSAAGKYMIEGRYVSNGGPMDVDLDSAGDIVDVSTEGSSSQPGLVNVVTDGEANDFIYHLFYTYPTVMINDQTRIKGEVRFIDRDIYGTSQSGENNINGNQEIWVRRLWAEWDSPVGTIHLGRMPGGAWGSQFLDNSNGSDRIKWVTNFMPQPFSLTFIWQKSTEKDGFTGTSDEADAASWYAGVGHKGDFGATTVALWHTRYDKDNGDYDNTHLWVNTAWKFNGFNLDTEWQYQFGDANAAGDDLSSLGVMANAYGNFGSATAGVLFFYLQGDDDPSDGDNEGNVGKKGVGNDYNPFLIATGDYTGLLNADKSSFMAAIDWNELIGGSAPTGDGDVPGIIALAGWARFAANEKLTLNAAIGQVWADKDFGLDNNDIGLEVDLGMSYKILDNLSYSLQGGYLATGDMVEDIFGTSEDIFMLVHSMTMTF
jgi:hypothetical protein